MARAFSLAGAGRCSTYQDVLSVPFTTGKAFSIPLRLSTGPRRYHYRLVQITALAGLGIRHRGRLGVCKNGCVAMGAARQVEAVRFYSENGKSKMDEFRRDTGQVPTPPKQTSTVTEKIQTKVLSALPNLTPHENIYNLPNFLTVSRLIAAPVTAYLLLHDHNKWALALFAYAGITDLVDGWIARRWKLQTVAGSVLDPGADKALMIILTVMLAVKGAIPLSLATLILGRDASLALAAIYYRYASLPRPKTFLRYWDFSLPSAEVHPTTVSKYNTFLQLILIGSTLTLPLLTTGGEYAHIFQSTLGTSDNVLKQGMTAFQVLVAGTTAWSGLSYAFLKRAVTILGEDEVLKAKQGRRGRAIIGVTFGSVVAAAVWIAIRKDEVPVKLDQASDAVE